MGTQIEEPSRPTGFGLVFKKLVLSVQRFGFSRFTKYNVRKTGTVVSGSITGQTEPPHHALKEIEMISLSSSPPSCRCRHWASVACGLSPVTTTFLGSLLYNSLYCNRLVSCSCNVSPSRALARVHMRSCSCCKTISICSRSEALNLNLLNYIKNSCSISAIRLQLLQILLS
ncbi:unnamed protein product [Citrullus colocynthis]|uniref:Uncharacterized protein n=1 Tax=Citrullus colocynthis TaxID=252529 RepID=A0ABP0Y9Z1_9ROSI